MKYPNLVNDQISLLREADVLINNDLMGIAKFLTSENMSDLLGNLSDEDLLYLPLTMSKVIAPENFDIIVDHLNHYEMIIK